MVAAGVQVVYSASQEEEIVKFPSTKVRLLGLPGSPRSTASQSPLMPVPGCPASGAAPTERRARSAEPAAAPAGDGCQDGSGLAACQQGSVASRRKSCPPKRARLLQEAPSDGGERELSELGSGGGGDDGAWMDAAWTLAGGQ